MSALRGTTMYVGQVIVRNINSLENPDMLNISGCIHDNYSQCTVWRELRPRPSQLLQQISV